MNTYDDGASVGLPMYSVSVLYLLETPPEETEAAFIALRDRFRTSKARNGWYEHLFKYNCGEIDIEELEKQAGESRYNQCEAFFFIGMKELGQGKRKTAQEYFQKSVDTHVWHWLDYEWSRAFLTRMEDPNWPIQREKGDAAH